MNTKQAYYVTVHHWQWQWQCKMVIRSLKTFNQCFCEVGQKSAIRDVDLQLAGGGGGGTTPPIPLWLRACKVPRSQLGLLYLECISKSLD